MSKPKILCLHGCHMTAATMQSCMSSYLKAGGKQVEWHFLDAPFAHPDGGRTWTDPPLRVLDLAADGKCALPVNYATLAATFALLDATIQEKGITHLLGFSQGAFAAVEYVRHTKPKDVRGVVAMAGYTFREEDDCPFEALSCPLLCIEHAMDLTVPPTCGYPLATERIVHNVKGFTEPTVDAHKIPTQAEYRNKVAAFVQETCGNTAVSAPNSRKKPAKKETAAAE